MQAPAYNEATVDVNYGCEIHESLLHRDIFDGTLSPGNMQEFGFITPADYTEGGRAYEIVCAIIDKIKADTNHQELKKI